MLERLRGQNSSGDVLILGIESSCDDTGVALLGEDGQVLGDAIHSQIHVHKEYVNALVILAWSLIQVPHVCIKSKQEHR